MKRLLTILIIILSMQHLGAEEVSEVHKTKIVNFDITIGNADKLSGYTRYQIGGHFIDTDGTTGKTYFPISELKFPLNVYMASATLNVTLIERLKIDFCFKKNLTTDAGKIKDWDWGIYSGIHTSLDVFSKSDSRLNSHIIDSCLSYILFKKEIVSLNIGARFLYQYFNYSISNLYQEDYVHQILTTIQEKTGKYKVEYYIPYLLNFSSCFVLGGSFKIEATLGLSPIVYAKDVDDHIERGKIMKGKSTGNSFLISLDTKYYANKNVFLGFNFEYIRIYTEGTQKQVFYRDAYEGSNFYPVGTTLSIGNVLRSIQYSFGLSAGCSF